MGGGVVNGFIVCEIQYFNFWNKLFDEIIKVILVDKETDKKC